MLNSTDQEVSTAHKNKKRQIKKFLALSHSDVFIMLINVKNANNCWHFNIYEHGKFHTQLC